ncbi:hypothetical protein Barb6_00900 [Bacteroidales bacterium Barb6]|nr:hypothetical protein Barb6_00900 [Bacteroidales bacterium Barb6]
MYADNGNERAAPADSCERQGISLFLLGKIQRHRKGGMEDNGERGTRNRRHHLCRIPFMDILLLACDPCG